MDPRLAANQANWDDRTSVHLESRFYDVEGWLRERRGPHPDELEMLGDVSGLQLVHLQCHFGLDTLAWARVGAQVTGLDFSAAAIDAARNLARRAELDDRSTFVQADVHDAVTALGGERFDIVYVSLGALCWLPSVDRWAEQVAALAAPGGRVFLHDVHPVSWALADDELRVEHTYFEESDPYVGESDATYTDASRPLQATRTFEWNHGIGEVVSALLGQGLVLDRLTEHDWTVWPRFPWLVEREPGRWGPDADHPRVPLSFTVLAHRPG